MGRNQYLTVILAVGSLIAPMGLSAAEEKPNPQTEPANGPDTGQASGATAGRAPNNRTPTATTTVTPQVTPLPQGIQITNTLTVNNPPEGAPPPAPAAPPVILNTPAPAAGSAAPPPAAERPAAPPPAAERPAARHVPLVDEKGRPIETVRFERKVRTGLIAGGATLFAVSYLATIVSAAAVGTDCDQGSASLGCTTERWPLFIPVAGPFLQLGYLEGGNAATARALLALDGVVQAGGVAMALVGLIVPKKVAVPVLLAGRVRVSPYGGINGSGLVATGAF